MTKKQFAHASLRGVSVSPQKVGLVLALVRGRPVEDAMTELMFCKKHVARDVRKLIASAAANAMDLFGVPTRNLMVSSIYCGPSMAKKRINFHAKGKTGRIRSGASSVYVTVSGGI